MDRAGLASVFNTLAHGGATAMDMYSKQKYRDDDLNLRRQVHQDNLTNDRERLRLAEQQLNLGFAKFQSDSDYRNRVFDLQEEQFRRKERTQRINNINYTAHNEAISLGYPSGTQFMLKDKRSLPYWQSLFDESLPENMRESGVKTRLHWGDDGLMRFDIDRFGDGQFENFMTYTPQQARHFYGQHRAVNGIQDFIRDLGVKAVKNEQDEYVLVDLSGGLLSKEKQTELDQKNAELKESVGMTLTDALTAPDPMEEMDQYFVSQYLTGEFKKEPPGYLKGDPSLTDKIKGFEANHKQRSVLQKLNTAFDRPTGQAGKNLHQQEFRDFLKADDTRRAMGLPTLDELEQIKQGEGRERAMNDSMGYLSNRDDTFYWGSHKKKPQSAPSAKTAAPTTPNPLDQAPKEPTENPQSQSQFQSSGDPVLDALLSQTSASGGFNPVQNTRMAALVANYSQMESASKAVDNKLFQDLLTLSETGGLSRKGGKSGANQLLDLIKGTLDVRSKMAKLKKDEQAALMQNDKDSLGTITNHLKSLDNRIGSGTKSKGGYQIGNSFFSSAEQHASFLFAAANTDPAEFKKAGIPYKTSAYSDANGDTQTIHRLDAANLRPHHIETLLEMLKTRTAGQGKELSWFGSDRQNFFNRGPIDPPHLPVDDVTRYLNLKDPQKQKLVQERLNMTHEEIINSGR